MPKIACAADFMSPKPAAIHEHNAPGRKMVHFYKVSRYTINRHTIHFFLLFRTRLIKTPVLYALELPHKQNLYAFDGNGCAAPHLRRILTNESLIALKSREKPRRLVQRRTRHPQQHTVKETMNHERILFPRLRKLLQQLQRTQNPGRFPRKTA
ncbi:MAG: hypothetical protein AAGU77_01545 [Bacillota bacterium]